MSGEFDMSWFFWSSILLIGYDDGFFKADESMHYANVNLYTREKFFAISVAPRHNVLLLSKEDAVVSESVKFRHS